MLFESQCVVCEGAVGPVCASCAESFEPAGRLQIDGFDASVAAFSLTPTTRSAIAALKYRRHRRVADVLARRCSALVPRAADAIVWMPSTPERRRDRGFDHAEAIARRLSSFTDVPAMRLLRRRPGDEQQTGKTRVERLAGPALVSVGPCPPFVVVVDDVVTTGSSMRAAAMVLRSAGAHRVVGVCIATTPSRREFSLHRLTKGCSVDEWT